MTLVKELLSDLEKGDRTEEQFKWMKFNKFLDGHKPVPYFSTTSSSITMFSTSTQTWRTF